MKLITNKIFWFGVIGAFVLLAVAMRFAPANIQEPIRKGLGV